MISVTQIKGLPVIDASKQNTRVGEVFDVVYDQNQQKIVALISDISELFGVKVILYKNISGIERTHITVPSSDVIKVAREVLDAFSNEDFLRATPVILRTKMIGYVHDLYFEESSGKVTGFLVKRNDGKFDRFNLDQLVDFGQNYITITDKHDQEIKTNIQNDKLVKKTTKNRENFISTFEKKVDETISSVKSSLRTMKKQVKPEESQLLGKYLTDNITTESQSLFAKKGELVSQKMLELADDYGVKEKIKNSVSNHRPH